MVVNLVLLSSCYISTAQQTETPSNTKEQPLEKATEVKEAPIKNPPLSITNPASNLVAGGTPQGQSPTNTQDGTLINRFKNIPVNLYMGTPIIGFPIYTLTSAGGASVPIGLSYNASGMKGHDVASWVGMNWQINFPQLSRIVRGIPDEGRYTLDNSYNKVARKGFYQYGLKADNDTENDSQADIYFLNINGINYKFSFDANKQVHFFPESDIEIAVQWQERSNVGDVVGTFKNWIVTMPDGTKYTFATTGSETESSFEMEAGEVTNGSSHFGTSNFYKYLEAEKTTSAWYLTKIETAFGDVTNFEYHPTYYSFFRIAEQEAITNNCTFTGIEKKINKVYVSSSTLFKISNTTHVVEINKGGWSQNTLDDGSTNWYLNDTYPNRKDIDIWGRYPANSASSRALHKLTVYAKDDSTKTFEWKFNYDYNYGTDPSNTVPFGYNYSTVGYTHQRRFKLRSIEEPDGNKYTFKYYDDDYILPSRFTQGIDHWGYLNGALSSNLMIGKDEYRNCANEQYGNRSATSGWSQYGTLTAISHSTGASTLLEYENNRATNYTPIIGGSRIKKITYLDSISNLKSVKKYDYLLSNGQSSGFLCLKPVYHFDDKNNYSGAYNQFWHSGLYQQLLAESGRPAVGYSRVKETILSNDEKDSLGYTISEFLQPLQEINLIETVTSNCVTQYPPNVPYPITTCDTNRYLRPWKWYPYHENTIGVPSRVAVYSKNNLLLSENTNTYAEQQVQGTTTYYQFGYRTFRLVGQNYNFERSYYDFFNTYRLIAQTAKSYSQDGTNPISSTTTYQYIDDLPDYRVNYPVRHNQIVRTATTDSYGNTISNWTKYAMDFEFGMSGLTNAEGQGIQALLQKGIKTAVIENITRVKQSINGNDEYITNANYQSYYATDSVGVKAGMPKSTFVLENVPRLNMTEAYNDKSNNTYTRSSDYDLKNTINAYTNIGLPLQSKTRFGATATTVYDATYSRFPISQTSNVGQISEQTTSAEYAKLLYGVSKQTGVNGLSLSNEYYSDGKLKQQTDKDGKVLKHVQYVYRGQADSDPLLTTNTTYNRVITRIPRIATTNPLNLTHLDCAISVVYLDGDSRVVEQIGYRASPNQKDLVSGVIDYDKFNRPQKTWLSIESTQSDGSFLDTASVKSIAKSFYNDAKPYSEVLQYEDSPLSRVFKSYGPGKVWQDSSKYVKMEFQTASKYGLLMVNNGDDYMANIAASGYELSKNIITNENGNKTIEYKDKKGNTVRKEVQVDANNYLTTLFCFDPAGRLRYIFPPKAVNALGIQSLNVESWSEFNENVFAFHYDGRGRVYEAHKAGASWERTVYNRLNQAVLTQNDDELAKNNTWNYLHTDGQGRTVRTGQMQLPANYTRAYLQSLFDNFIDDKQFEERSTASGNIQEYTNRSFPTALRTYITNLNWKTHTYYDDYTWTKKSNWDGASAENDYAFQTHPFGAVVYANAKGLSTGSKIKYEIWGDDNWFSSVNYFDDKNQIIQNINTNHLLKRNQRDFQYNFIGETLRNRTIHRKAGIEDQAISHKMVYDHTGRSKEIYYTLVQGTTKKIDSLLMLSNAFDGIGRIKVKYIQPNANVVSSIQSGDWTFTNTWANGVIPSLTTPAIISQVHSITIPANTTVQAGTLYDAGTLKFLTNSILQLGTLAPVRSAALQSIAYSYDVRGRMIGVNTDASGNPRVSQDKLFSYKLDYSFDGLIAKQTWKDNNNPQNRSYNYSYDLSSRLKNAQYSGVGNENYSVNTDYDANGNIQHLQRYSQTGANTYGLVDNLTYSYIGTGNKLRKISDAVSGNVSANDFRAAGVPDVTGNDYAYTVDGKMTKDNNKGISSIRYNFLDLVSSSKFSNNDSVSYWYSSTGSRIQRKVVKAGQPDSYTIYDGEMVYTYTGTSPSLAGFSISEIQNSEGRFVNGRLEYGYTDHVGNLRLSYKDSLGTAFITQSQSYDPWSNVNAGSEYQLTGFQKDKYLVSGKESDNLTGNILLDWRDYDSVTGRMNSYDPDGSDGSQISLSPFAYGWNNPVSLNDPNGRCPLCIGAAIALFSGHISGMIASANGGSYGKGFLTGAITSAIGSGVGAGMAGILGQAGTFGGAVLRGAAGGFVSGGISGGIGSIMNGSSFESGFLGGAISGGISGGIMGGISHLAVQSNGMGFIGPTDKGHSKLKYESVDVTESSLDEFAKDAFGNNYKSKFGVRKLHIGNKVPQGSGYSYDVKKQLLIRNEDGFQAGGITLHNVGLKSSDIYISGAVFKYRGQLFNTIGHEFIHSYHYSIGLSIGITASEFTKRTEYAAYRWSALASDNIGFGSSTSASYMGMMKLYTYDSRFSWSEIPNFPTIKFWDK